MKLKKRLPESRSQKRERLASDRDRRALDRAQMFDRREAWLAQQEQGKALYHEWHHAVTNRLTSEEAYARFEEIHAHYWDFFRHAGLPSTELSLAIQRHRDGKPGEPEPIIAALEIRITKRLLRIAKQVARRGALSENQKCRLCTLILACIDFPRWHREFTELARLARALAHPELRAQLEARLPDAHAAALLQHLDQEAKIKHA